MFLAELFLVISLQLTSEALQCNRYRARNIMNVAMNNKCYYVWPRKRRTYNEAVKLCQKGGTHVLFTETKVEHHRLMSRLSPAFTRIWIGLEKNGSEWRWQGGQRSRPVEKLLFADNHASTKGHNAIARKLKGRYIWQVQDPNNTFRIVCEQEQDKNTADRVFEESSSDDRYETTGVLANSESADSVISTETEGSWAATDTSSQFVAEQGTPHVQGSLTETVVMATGVQTITMEHFFAPEQSSNLGDSSFLGQIINPGQTIKLEKTFAPKQSSSLVYSSLSEQVINPGQTVKREQTFTTKQSSRGGDSNLKETHITSEHTIDQVSDIVFEAQSSNPQQASVRQQNNTVRQDPLDKETQETTSIFDQGTVSSLEILSVGFSATTVPTPASTTLRTGQYPGTEPLPSVDVLISSTITSQIHSVRRTVGDRASPLAVTESHQLSSPIHPPIDLRENSIDLSFRSTFSSAFVGPSLITAISSNNRLTSPLSSIGSVENSPKSVIMESSIPELTSGAGSGSVLRLSLELTSIIGYSASGTIGLAANLVIVPTAFAEIGPPASGDTESSASGGVISSSAPVVIKPTAAGAIGSVSPLFFRSSTLDRILPSTSDVTVVSASDLTGSLTSGMIESSAFGGIESALSLIRSAASGVIWSPTSGVIAPTASDNVEPSASGAITSPSSGGVSGSLAPVVVWSAGAGAVGLFGSGVSRSSSLDMIWSTHSDVIRSFTSGEIESSAFGLVELTASVAIGLSGSGVMEPSASHLNELSTPHVIESSAVIGPTAYEGMGTPSSGGVIGSLAPVALWPTGDGAIVSFAPSVLTSSALDMIGSSTSDMIMATVSDLTGPFVSGIIEPSAYNVMEWPQSSASGFTRLSSSGLNETPFSGLSVLSASDMLELPVSDAFVSDVIGSYAFSAVRASTFRTTGSFASDEIGLDASGPVSSLVSSATLEQSANIIRIRSNFSSLSHASAVLAKNKSDSTNPASVPLDTPTSSRQEPLTGAITDPVQVTIATPTSERVLTSVTTTGSFDDWTEISKSSEPILHSIPTISVTMPTTSSVALATSSPRDMGHVQNNVPKILEAGYYVVANSFDQRNNIETFAFRKVTTITDVTMTTTFPATTTINCARLCASGQYECNIVVFKDRICRLYSL